MDIFSSVLLGFGGPTGSHVERTLEDRIEGLFDRAAAQSPCILYLRRMEQACRSTGQTSNEIKGQVGSRPCTRFTVARHTALTEHSIRF